MSADRAATADSTLAVMRAAALLDGANMEFDEGNRRFAGMIARDAGEQLRDALVEGDLDIEELPELFEQTYQDSAAESIDDRLMGAVGAEETEETTEKR